LSGFLILALGCINGEKTGEGVIPPPNGTPSFMPGGGEMDMNLSELRKRPNLSDNARREGVHEAMHDKQGGMPPR